LEFVEALGSGFYDLGFRLEDFASGNFSEDSHEFTHAPAWGADHCEARWSRLKKCSAIPFYDDDSVRKTLARFNLEAGKVDALQLSGGVHGI
jgi:hypothetical protein